jgi:hypothetical protein
MFSKVSGIFFKALIMLLVKYLRVTLFLAQFYKKSREKNNERFFIKKDKKPVSSFE